MDSFSTNIVVDLVVDSNEGGSILGLGRELGLDVGLTEGRRRIVGVEDIEGIGARNAGVGGLFKSDDEGSFDSNNIFQ